MGNINTTNHPYKSTEKIYKQLKIKNLICSLHEQFQIRFNISETFYFNLPEISVPKIAEAFT